jgi:hypothetical protein
VRPQTPLAVSAGRPGRLGRFGRLARVLDAQDAATRDAIRAFWTRAHDDGLLPAGCDLTWLADTTSVLAHAETYLLMRETLGMTPQRYQSWLATTWRRMAAAAG